MTPRKSLARLELSASRRLDRLERVACEAFVSLSGRDAERAITFVVIELHSTWGNFVRAFYLSCLLSTRTRTGAVVASPYRACVSSISDGIGLAIRAKGRRTKAKPKSDGTWHPLAEPAWHKPSVLQGLACCYGFSNASAITTAFSHQTAVFEHLPTVRNYFAHRGQATSREALDVGQSYGILVDDKPSAMLTARALGRPQRLILDWINDIRLVIDLLCT